MGLIAKRPWILIIAWLIIVLVSAPLASKINDIVVTSETGFLPEDAESIRAMKAMESLYEPNGLESIAGGSPDYLIVVHGVPVSLESYWKLKTPYFNLENKSVELLSWIDLTAEAEASIRASMAEAVNGSIGLFNGIVELNNGYIGALEAVNKTVLLIVSTDTLYSSLYNSSKSLADSVDQLRSAGDALIKACTAMGPLYTSTYYNVIRVETLLETLTDAYETGKLDEQDIMVVVNSSLNLTQHGIQPVTPSLVRGVYMQILMMGGSEAFNNTIGASITYNLVKESLQEDTLFMLDAVHRAWIETVSTDIDHRMIARLGGIVDGQINLLSRISKLYIESKPAIVEYASEGILKAMPDSAKPIIALLADEISRSECNISLDDALRGSLMKLYVSQGFDPITAKEIVDSIMQGRVSNEQIASIAVAYLKKTAGIAEIEELEPALIDVLLTMDPEGTGILSVPSNAVKGAALILGVDAQQADSIDAVAYALVERKVAEEGGQGLQLLYYMREKGLLGLDRGEILAAAPSIAVELMAQNLNSSVDRLEPIVNEAYRVYIGEASIDEAVDRLTRNALAEVFSNIIDRLKGLMVEKGLEGFMITLNPSGKNTGDKIDTARTVKEELSDIFTKAGYYNAEAYLAGNSVIEHEIREAAQRDIERTDKLSMVFVILILGLVLESVAAVFLPFIGIGFGLIVSLAAAYIIASAGLIDVTTQSRTIMFTTGLGLGIDYAAYISKRFREAMAKMPPREAAEEAFRRSWKPVLAGAMTASIGFGSMMLAKDFPFIYSIGSNVPLTILAVMIASITFIPALLAYVGEKRWFWWPSKIEYRASEPRVMRRIGQVVLRNPIVPIAVVVILSVFAAYQYFTFEGSYDLSLNLPRDSEARLALDIVYSYYDPGSLYPVYIVASSSGSARGIVDVVSGLDCTASASIAEGFRDRVVRVILAVDPNSREGVECVSQIRDESHKIDPDSLVGGAPAINLDFENLLNEVFYGRVYPVALLLMFLTLLIAYGGVAVALGAVAGVVLAAVWSTAFTTYAYQNVMGSEVLWFLPVIVFTAILGVGMDYNSFFIARAREECEAECSREGALRGVAYGSLIVLGLSTIMAGAYVGLALASSPGLSQMGIALTLGVLLAGVNASLIITPPLIALLGRRAWWPSRLRKG